jgi:hypothetical protein
VIVYHFTNINNNIKKQQWLHTYKHLTMAKRKYTKWQNDGSQNTFFFNENTIESCLLFTPLVSGHCIMTSVYSCGIWSSNHDFCLLLWYLATEPWLLFTPLVSGHWIMTSVYSCGIWPLNHDFCLLLWYLAIESWHTKGVNRSPDSMARYQRSKQKSWFNGQIPKE